MKRLLLLALMLLGRVAEPQDDGDADEAEVIGEQACAQDHILVKFKPDADAAGPCRDHGAAGHRRLWAGTHRVGVPPGADLRRWLKKFRTDPRVVQAQLDRTLTLDLTPNDPYFSSSGAWNQGFRDLWGLQKIQADKAWDVTTGSPSVIVAVIDTGIDVTHPDLAGNLWRNPRETAGNGKDDDGNGFVDDTVGWNFIDDTPDVHDDYGHGTHCAGTIAAVGNNGRGVVGVAWACRIMALKVFNAQGRGNESDAAQAIRYAADNGARVTSNSYRFRGTSTVLQDAIRYAESRGCITTVSAGNENTDMSACAPANIPEAVTVAAVDVNDKKASFSNYGTGVDVSAPGVDILSLRAAGTTLGYPVNSELIRLSGTSMACPHAAGVLALIASKFPNAAPGFIVGQLKRSTDPIDSINKAAMRGKLGTGRINAFKALADAPDLAVVEIEPQASEGEAGTMLPVADSVRNSSNADAGPFSISYRLSKNAVWGDADDVVVATTRAVAGLAAGATDAGATLLAIPANTPPGDYFVLAMADSGDAVFELDESNNTSASSALVKVRIRPVDLAGVDVRFTARTVDAGGTLAVTSTVENRGSFPAGGFVVSFRLSRNQTWGDDDDVAIASTRIVGSLAPAASSTASTSLSIPSTAPAGDYYVLIKADGAGAIPEADEANNVAASSMRVTLPLPDLVVTNISTTTASVARGGRFTVSNAVRNTGGSWTGPFAVRFVLSANSTIGDGDDIPLAPDRTVDGLAPGATSSASTVVSTDSPGLSPGTYYLGAIVDPAGSVAESNERNNVKSGPVRVTIR